MQHTYSNTVSTTLPVAVYAHDVFDNCFATFDLFSYRGRMKRIREIRAVVQTGHREYEIS